MSFITTTHRLADPRHTPLPLSRTLGEAVLPAMLDRLADIELQHGHDARAEELSQLAQELREQAR